MEKKRQSFSKDFKGKVALDFLLEESTIQEIAEKRASFRSSYPNGSRRQLLEWQIFLDVRTRSQNEKICDIWYGAKDANVRNN